MMERDSELVDMEKNTNEVQSDDDDIQMDPNTILGKFPNNRAGLLASNEIYQEALGISLKKIEERMKENEEKRRILDLELQESLKFKHVHQWHRVPVLHYIPPYFRDFAGMAPKPNADTVARSRDEVLDSLAEPSKRWSRPERAKLMQTIRDALVYIQSEPLLKKQIELEEKIKTAGVDENGAMLKEIGKIKKQIAKAKKKFDMSKAPQILIDRIDWKQISIKMVDNKAPRSEIECRLAYFNIMHPSLNQDERWTEAELEKLKRLVDKYEQDNWPIIAEKLGTHRTAFQCFQKFQLKLNEDMSMKDWDDTDDKKLVEAIEQCKMGDYIPWDQVAGLIEGRTRAQCQGRWARKLDPDLKYGRWSEQEDHILMMSIRKFGVRGWRKIARDVPGRSEAQCRERWNSALRGDIKVGPWEREEDKLLKEAVDVYGIGKWSRICTMLTGRTPAACKMRFRTLRRLENKKQAQTIDQDMDDN